MPTESLPPLPPNGLSALQKILRAATEPTPDLSAVQKLFAEPAYVNQATTFMAVGGTRKGYQFEGRIIRPNSFGIYTPDNAAETTYLNQLVTAGVMVVAAIASPSEA